MHTVLIPPFELNYLQALFSRYLGLVTFISNPSFFQSKCVHHTASAIKKIIFSFTKQKCKYSGYNTVFFLYTDVIIEFISHAHHL